jgi:hypothetical protein
MDGICPYSFPASHSSDPDPNFRVVLTVMRLLVKGAESSSLKGLHDEHRDFTPARVR